MHFDCVSIEIFQHRQNFVMELQKQSAHQWACPAAGTGTIMQRSLGQVVRKTKGIVAKHLGRGAQHDDVLDRLQEHAWPRPNKPHCADGLLLSTVLNGHIATVRARMCWGGCALGGCSSRCLLNHRGLLGDIVWECHLNKILRSLQLSVCPHRGGKEQRQDLTNAPSKLSPLVIAPQKEGVIYGCPGTPDCGQQATEAHGLACPILLLHHAGQVKQCGR